MKKLAITSFALLGIISLLGPLSLVRAQTPVEDVQVYPQRYQIRVVSPNGGEVWDRNQTQTIRWEVMVPPVEPPMVEGKSNRYWGDVSIDLFRVVTYTPPYIYPCPSGQLCTEDYWGGKSWFFVKHLATVNLFDRVYSWKIGNDIPNGGDYLIRISPRTFAWTPLAQGQDKELKTFPEDIELRQPVEPIPFEKPVRPVEPLIIWDQSDAPFTIDGETVPQPIPKLPLAEIIKILENISRELIQVIDLLRKMMVGY